MALATACGAASPATTASPSGTAAAPSPTPSAAVAGPAAPAPSGSAGSSTPVPQPGPTQAAAAPTTAPELPTVEGPLDEAIPLETGFEIEIVSIRAVQVAATTPGEVAGSALRVEVLARNGSQQPQSVDSAVVTLVAADGEPGIDTTAGSPSPLRGTVAPGDAVTGSYVFMLDPADGREVTVSVNYAAGQPVAVFTGTTA